MKKLLVFQHVPFEIMGSLNPLLKEAGFRIRYVNLGRHPDARPELDGYSGLVILGGPMSAYEVEHGHLATEVGLIRTALERDLGRAADRALAQRPGAQGRAKDSPTARHPGADQAGNAPEHPAAPVPE